MSAAPVLRIPLTRVLYRTRGRHFDYTFLMQPDPLIGEGWYAIHRSIFARVEPALSPWRARGVLPVSIGYDYLATAFADAQRRDSQGRPIAHYLVWLDDRAAVAAGDPNFGPALIDDLAPAIEAVFDLDPRDLEAHTARPLDVQLRQRFRDALGGRRAALLERPRPG
jgi:hypothetical protein